MWLDVTIYDDQKRADIINNVCLAINILTVVVNVIISAFDIKALDQLPGLLGGGDDGDGA